MLYPLLFKQLDFVGINLFFVCKKQIERGSQQTNFVCVQQLRLLNTDIYDLQVSIFSLVIEENENLKVLRSLRTLRALRPLRAISRWQGMRVCTTYIIKSSTLPYILHKAILRSMSFVEIGSTMKCAVESLASQGKSLQVSFI